MTATEQGGARGLHVRRPAVPPQDESAQGKSAQSAFPALDRLVPDPAEFASVVWGNAPLLTRAADLPGGLEDLLSEQAVDELLSTHGLRTPFLRVANQGQTLPNGAFTSGGGVGAGIGDQLDDSRLTSLFADGSTIVLQALHRTWPPVLRFTQQLVAELGHPVQVNAYVTPPQSRGFDDHYDVHDVFVVQVGGRKRWRIHAPVHEAPLRDQPWTDRRDAVRAEAEREPLIDAVLEPGDCLYLPRGTLHAATALGDVSTHLTFGIHVWHRHHLAQDLATEALRMVAEQVDVRDSLPVGVDVSAADDLGAHAEIVRQRLVDAVRDVPLERLAEALARRDATSSRPEPIGPLAQLRSAQDVRDDTPLRLRELLGARLDGSVLRTRVGDVDVGEVEPEPLSSLLDGQVVLAGEFGLETIKRLLAAGIVVVP